MSLFVIRHPDAQLYMCYVTLRRHDTNNTIFHTAHDIRWHYDIANAIVVDAATVALIVGPFHRFSRLVVATAPAGRIASQLMVDPPIASPAPLTTEKHSVARRIFDAVRFSSRMIAACLCFLLLAGCAARSIHATLGDTVADFESQNKAFHLVDSSTSGTGPAVTERRTYRDWSWTSPGSYVRQNRTFTITVVAGRVTSITEGE